MHPAKGPEALWNPAFCAHFMGAGSGVFVVVGEWENARLLLRSGVCVFVGVGVQRIKAAIVAMSSAAMATLDFSMRILPPVMM